MSGKVYIVGAGPGSAELLTLRAASRLRAAQVVLHDDLVPVEILEFCHSAARVVNVGKRCGRHANSQEQINALMVWHARKAKTVVRLKSGDPAVFGRLGEELEALRRANVEFEIVPGITAASAAAAGAGITLTDRRAASALVTLTGHSSREEKLHSRGFDPQHTAFAVYMPGPDYGRTANELMESGVDAGTPCVVVSHAGQVSQEVRFMPLAALSSASGIAAPAILIVGEVARKASSELAPRRHGAAEKSFSEIANEVRDSYPPLSL